MGKLFGTDGIRAKAGEYPLTEPLVFSLGCHLVQLLRKKGFAPRIIIGWDTRESSPWLARTVAAGAVAEGAEVVLAGILPTSAISYLTREHQFPAGVMISASHNPYEDNGIKIFQLDGLKLADHQEEELEAILLTTQSLREAKEYAERMDRTTNGHHPKIAEIRKPATWSQAKVCRPELVDPVMATSPDSFFQKSYLDFLRKNFSTAGFQNGPKIVVDCAHGAGSAIAPFLFAELGFKVVAINAQPNGRNINTHCGALHPENLAEQVKIKGADLGVALDGDADRAILVDEKGKILNGDYTLYILARSLLQRNLLPSPLVVATIMSNMGLELALSRLGLKLRRTRVGDRYVLEEMLRSGARLGGERSGHTILLDICPTGDGLLTTLKIAETMLLTGKKLSDLAAGLTEFPQLLVNVPVKRRVDFSLLPGWEQVVGNCRQKLGPYGRIEVRYSGTEPVVRVMVEAEEEELVRESAETIAQFIQIHLGGE